MVLVKPGDSRCQPPSGNVESCGRSLLTSGKVFDEKSSDVKGHQWVVVGWKKAAKVVPLRGADQGFVKTAVDQQ